ncbi:hypothetical protein PG994_009895 [Apiospora phragmitis]|uniref:Uncharacterized protein n=1 Tax=Apiospora phragmitis TaxID=2905665 RepID=A0ABR1TNC6_9PEZI
MPTETLAEPAAASLNERQPGQVPKAGASSNPPTTPSPLEQQILNGLNVLFPSDDSTAQGQTACAAQCLLTNLFPFTLTETPKPHFGKQPCELDNCQTFLPTTRGNSASKMPLEAHRLAKGQSVHGVQSISPRTRSRIGYAAIPASWLPECRRGSLHFGRDDRNGGHQQDTFSVYTAPASEAVLAMFRDPDHTRDPRDFRLIIECEKVAAFPLLGLAERLGRLLGSNSVRLAPRVLLRRSARAIPRTMFTSSGQKLTQVAPDWGAGPLSAILSKAGSSLIRPLLSQSRWLLRPFQTRPLLRQHTHPTPQDSQSSGEEVVEAVSRNPSQPISTSNDSNIASPLSEHGDADIEASLPKDARSEPGVGRIPSSRRQRSGSRRQSKRRARAPAVTVAEPRKQKQCSSPTELVVTESKKHKKCPSQTDLATRLTNANSIRRFITHVTIWRSSSVTLPAFRITGDWAERAAKHYILGDSLDNSTKLYKFLSLLVKIQVAQSIDKEAAALGYERVPADMIKKVLEKLRKGVDPKIRKKF